MRVGKATYYADPAAVPAPLQAMARATSPDTFDCLVFDKKGNVVVRVDGYQTIPLPAPLPDAIAATLRDAFNG